MCRYECHRIAVVAIPKFGQCGGKISPGGCNGPTCPGGCNINTCKVACREHNTSISCFACEIYTRHNAAHTHLMRHTNTWGPATARPLQCQVRTPGMLAAWSSAHCRMHPGRMSTAHLAPAAIGVRGRVIYY